MGDVKSAAGTANFAEMMTSGNRETGCPPLPMIGIE
jgi:hypothetical protein